MTALQAFRFLENSLVEADAGLLFPQWRGCSKLLTSQIFGNSLHPLTTSWLERSILAANAKRVRLQSDNGCCDVAHFRAIPNDRIRT